MNLPKRVGKGARKSLGFPPLIKTRATNWINCFYSQIPAPIINAQSLVTIDPSSVPQDQKYKTIREHLLKASTFNLILSSSSSTNQTKPSRSYLIPSFSEI